MGHKADDECAPGRAGSEPEVEGGWQSPDRRFRDGLISRRARPPQRRSRTAPRPHSACASRLRRPLHGTPLAIPPSPLTLSCSYDFLFKARLRRRPLLGAARPAEPFGAAAPWGALTCSPAFPAGCAHRRLGRGQVQHALSLHAQRVLPRVQVNNWRRVCHTQHPGMPVLALSAHRLVLSALCTCRWTGRRLKRRFGTRPARSGALPSSPAYDPPSPARKLPRHHQRLLPRRGGRAASVRHHQAGCVSLRSPAWRRSRAGQ